MAMSNPLLAAKRYLHNKRVQRRYATELALIHDFHENSNTHPSIIHFSLNKAATQTINSLLKRCALTKGMVPVALHEYAFHSDFPFLDHLSVDELQPYSHIFKPTGYLYGPFGGMIEAIPELTLYKVVFVTRDPRDILVSEYFSMAHSHPEPGRSGDKLEDFDNKRALARNKTIDDYVRLQGEGLKQCYARYQTLLLDRLDTIYVTSYEAMLGDFEAWLKSLLAYCELDIDAEIVKQLEQEHADSRPLQEDKSRHLRKGQPGDYKEKLKPETVAWLNELFQPVLSRFGYSTD